MVAVKTFSDPRERVAAGEGAEKIESTGPLCTIRPASMMAISLPRRSASPRSWVT